MYKILARKYRPSQFSEIVEQDHVTLTLTRAIKNNKIGHAYLFSGPRGVGKTTVARVLVKTLNCQQPKEAGTQCCRECTFCQEVDKGLSLDYQEIDGASHRGIDQIREIKNNLPYASAQQKYRVFVIDEVHMLTAEAFNAMLKSLEEPPSKVIFILCTTESGKIPLTIRSRCQHFRFKLVSLGKLQEILLRITKKENIAIDEGSLFYIAKHAAGSIRDAQNLLEQVMAYAGDEITQDKVLTALGEVSKQILFTFVTQLEAGKLAENYLLVEKFIAEGGQFITFLYELVSLYSVFIYLQEGIKETELLYMSSEEVKLFYPLSHRFERYAIYRILDILFAFLQELKNTTEEKSLRDLALIKLHRYKDLINNEEIRTSLKLLADASVPTKQAASPQTASSSAVKTTAAPATPGQRQEAPPPPARPQAQPAAQLLDVSASPEITPQLEVTPIKRGTNMTANPPRSPTPNATQVAATSVNTSAPVKNPPSQQVEAPTRAGKCVIITQWNESSYRSLLRIVSNVGHDVYEKLKQLRFATYQEGGTLQLWATTSTAQQILGEDFTKELLQCLTTLTENKLIVVKAPIRSVVVMPDNSLVNAEKVMDVFEEATLVE